MPSFQVVLSNSPKLVGGLLKNVWPLAHCTKIAIVVEAAEAKTYWLLLSRQRQRLVHLLPEVKYSVFFWYTWEAKVATLFDPYVGVFYNAWEVNDYFKRSVDCVKSKINTCMLKSVKSSWKVSSKTLSKISADERKWHIRDLPALCCEISRWERWNVLNHANCRVEKISGANRVQSLPVLPRKI